MSGLSYWKLAQLLLLSASITAIVLYPKLPVRSVSLYPNAQAAWVSYTDRIFGGNTRISTQHNEADWGCHFEKSDVYALCGHGLMFYPDPQKAKPLLDSASSIRSVPVGNTFDFTHYDGIEVSLKYDGPAERIRFSLTNYEPESDRIDDDHQHRFMDSFAHKSELNAPIFIAFEEFRVADWWMSRYHMYRSKAVARFDNVRAFYVELIDQPDQSHHHIEVTSIKVIGRWITREHLYGGIISLWALLLLGELCNRFIVRLQHHQRLQHAQNVNFAYQQALSGPDNLSPFGLLQKAAIEPIVQHAFSESGFPQAAVLLIQVNALDQSHTDVLHADIVKCLQENTRHSDFIGHWEAQQYLVVAQLTTVKNGVVFSNKLFRVLMESLRHTQSAQLHIGFTLSHSHENFRHVVERAEQALALAATQDGHACRGL